MTRKQHERRMRALKLNNQREKSPGWYKQYFTDGTFLWRYHGQKTARKNGEGNRGKGK